MDHSPTPHWLVTDLWPLTSNLPIADSSLSTDWPLIHTSEDPLTTSQLLTSHRSPTHWPPIDSWLTTHRQSVDHYQTISKNHCLPTVGPQDDNWLAIHYISTNWHMQNSINSHWHHSLALINTSEHPVKCHWPLADQWPLTDHPLTDHPLTTHWQSVYHSLTIRLPLIDNPLTTHWQSAYHSLTICWPLPDHLKNHCLPTDWPQTDNSVPFTNHSLEHAKFHVAP